MVSFLIACWRRNRFFVMLANAKTAARWEEGFRSVLLHRVDNQCDAASLLHHLDALVHNHCSCLPLPVFVAHTCVAFPCARLRPTNDPTFLERTRLEATLDRLDHNVVFVCCVLRNQLLRQPLDKIVESHP